MSEMCDLLTIFKNKFRKIENLTKKCVNLEGAIKFNKTCLNNRIYPVHVKIYVYIYIRYMITPLYIILFSICS